LFIEALKSQTQIILAEAQGKSWMQRNWRPLLMMVCIAIVANNYILVPWLMVFTSKVAVLTMPDKLWTMMIIGIGGYVGGRTVEKTAATLTGTGVVDKIKGVFKK
jgi:predicted MFS family arabinose efflux permease